MEFAQLNYCTNYCYLQDVNREHERAYSRAIGSAGAGFWSLKLT